MAKMVVTKNFRLDPAADARLKRLAKERNVSQAEIVRAAIRLLDTETVGRSQS